MKNSGKQSDGVCGRGSKPINVRLDAPMAQYLTTAAANAGGSMAAYIRGLIIKDMKEVQSQETA